MCRDLRWAALIIIAMLGICILTGMASAGSNLEIRGFVKPSVEVTVSQDDCTWVLTPKAPGSRFRLHPDCYRPGHGPERRICLQNGCDLHWDSGN
jgi:hypothetical protein